MTCQSDRTSGRDQTRAESSDPCNLPYQIALRPSERSRIQTAKDHYQDVRTGPEIESKIGPKDKQGPGSLAPASQIAHRPSDHCALPIRLHFRAQRQLLVTNSWRKPLPAGRRPQVAPRQKASAGFAKRKQLWVRGCGAPATSASQQPTAPISLVVMQ